VLPAAKDLKRVLHQVTEGGTSMPAFNGILTPQQIADVGAYVVKEIAASK
jgi:mono/diheme cytochrome c family protein